MRRYDENHLPKTYQKVLPARKLLPAQDAGQLHPLPLSSRRKKFHTCQLCHYCLLYFLITSRMYHKYRCFHLLLLDLFYFSKNVAFQIFLRIDSDHVYPGTQKYIRHQPYLLRNHFFQGYDNLTNTIRRSMQKKW